MLVGKNAIEEISRMKSEQLELGAAIASEQLSDNEARHLADRLGYSWSYLQDCITLAQSEYGTKLLGRDYEEPNWDALSFLDDEYSVTFGE